MSGRELIVIALSKRAIAPLRARYDLTAMRVVHLESGDKLGGGAEQVRYLLAGLAARGVDNVLVCRPGSALATAARGCEIIELPMHGDADLAQLRRLRRVFARVAPDLVHVHSRRGADLFGGWAARLAGRPAVLTRRVEDREPDAWLRLKCRPYRAVIAISRAIERRLTEDIGLDAARVYRVPSGVDTERYHPGPCRAGLLEQLALPPEALVVGVVAQLIPRKGHAALLAALARLKDTHPLLRVVCFGRGPLAQPLRDISAELGLDPYVRWAGHREDLPALVPGLDLLVHPAVREGLGVALLEALSAGVPVIASAVGGIPDIIEHGVQGQLVPAGDVNALAAAIAALADDPQARRRMGRAGRARVEAQFSAAGMASAHLPVYEAVLAQRHDQH
jgi:glycosyltransferase involved in cell wall biosynthesis